VSRAVVEALAHAVDGDDVDEGLMEEAMEAILAGEASEAEIAGLAVALRMKGETTDEIAAAARVMRRRCVRVELATRPDEVVVDTCGTGGDGTGSFNVSTAAAFVVASAGVKVAKHGNRAVSSRSGSADVLEALGARLDVSPAEVASSVAECGIGFLFAPSHHGALRHAAPVRRALGLRTFFNLLGPLSNPAGATHQLVGVYDGRRLRQIAEVLGRLGVRGAWVVHGEGGLDEISPTGPSRVAVLAVGPEGIVGGDARENAEILERIFSGEPVLQRAAVVLNAASALLAAGVSVSPMEAASRVRRAIDEGRAAAVLQDFLAHNRRTS
jgi:anthranilate phosphoribosyltransferase